MITENEIKKTLVQKLKSAGFNIPATETKDGFPRPAAFVNVYPSAVTLVSADVEDVSDTIEIKYFPLTETTEECSETAQRIRELLLYEPFRVCDRHITIQSIEFDIENCVLQVYFDMEYTQMTPHKDKEYENMEELIIKGGI